MNAAVSVASFSTGSTCTGTYTIVAGDITAGSVTNLAVAHDSYDAAEVAAPDQAHAAAIVAIDSNQASAVVTYVAGPTPTPTVTPTSTEQVGGATATPRLPTLLPTSTPSGGDGGTSSLFVPLFSLVFGVLGLMVVMTQRRALRS